VPHIADADLSHDGCIGEIAVPEGPQDLGKTLTRDAVPQGFIPGIAKTYCQEAQDQQDHQL
jgi:hypothetical protein